MTKYSMQAEPKQLNRLQREVLDTLCIENRETKRSAALTRCVSETLSTRQGGRRRLARANPYCFARRTKVLKGIWSIHPPATLRPDTFN